MDSPSNIISFAVFVSIIYGVDLVFGVPLAVVSFLESFVHEKTHNLILGFAAPILAFPQILPLLIFSQSWQGELTFAFVSVEFVGHAIHVIFPVLADPMFGLPSQKNHHLEHTVNVSARMESTSEPGCIHCSEKSALLLMKQQMYVVGDNENRTLVVVFSKPRGRRQDPVGSCGVVLGKNRFESWRVEDY